MTDYIATTSPTGEGARELLSLWTGKPYTPVDRAEREAAIARKRLEATIRKTELALASAQAMHRKGEPWGEYVTRYHAIMDAAEARIAARIAELDDERAAAREAAIGLTVESITKRRAA
jgi:hypothetical protein